MPQLANYRPVAELAQGAVANVHLAMMTGPDGCGFSKLAVVKRLRESCADAPVLMELIKEEARITARLRHPNVVQALEVRLDGDDCFLAMEYVDGQALDRIRTRAAERGVSLSQRAEYAIVADTLAGLHHAHELVDYDGTPLEVIHRDVTPSNILVTVDGQVKLVGFGLANAAGRATETQHGVLRGPLRYMSPERVMGQTIDRRADIFAAGILLWEAATGKRFWGDLDDLAIVRALVDGSYETSPRLIDPEVPEELDLLCRRALAHDVTERFSTAAELGAALETFLGEDIRAARHELGPLVTSMFAAERAAVQKLIQHAASATPGRRAVPDPLAARPTAAHASSVGPFVVPVAADFVDPSASTVPSTPAPPLVAAPRNGVRLLKATSAMVAIVVAGLMALTSIGDASGTGASAPREPAQATSLHAALALRSDAFMIGPSVPPNAAIAVAASAASAVPPTKAARRPRPAPAAALAARPAPRPRAEATAATRLTLDTSDPWSAPPRRPK